MVELEPEGAMNGASSNGRRPRADVVRGDAAAGEERPEVDGRAVDGGVAAAGPLDLGDLEPAALGGLGDRLGLEDAGVERGGARGSERVAVEWNVLLVEPWTPGQAPVASVYQPAPVFGGAWVSRPLPDAFVPFLRNAAIVGITPCGRVLRDEVLAHAVGGEEDGLAGG